jgi:starvation-inducible outer membrane lipoprotein
MPADVLRDHLQSERGPGILCRTMSTRRFKTCKWRTLILILCGGLAAMQACASIPTFSPLVMEGIDEQFDVAVWWKTPHALVGRKVELGGRLVRADVKNGETYLVVSHLPIVDQLVYESFETPRPTKEYGIYYRATIDPKWLQAGNHLMVVGITSQPRTVSINGRQQTIPFVTAECLHLWKSAGTPPPPLPLATAEKFNKLEQATYCSSGY